MEPMELRNPWPAATVLGASPCGNTQPGRLSGQRPGRAPPPGQGACPAEPGPDLTETRGRR